MSPFRLPTKPQHSLPDTYRNIYEWLHCSEPTWRYTIYRTTYIPQSHAVFPRMVDLTTRYTKDEFFNRYEGYRRNSPRANEFKMTLWHELW
ncbi:hypothetical protein N7541_001084 [Penicillium brevicompactum]|uniref:Uncharacterized protein n=1 Tax=Penicillium brevicompactum TaxID=5074 RepID=A0A9W9RVF6_PENBR|nr:hypothetical protein N7541_001084 [Penicillium brevicompactum]